MFANLKIVTRLTAAFGVLLLFVAVIGGTAWYGMGKMECYITGIANTDAALAESAQLARVNINTLRRYEKDLFINIGDAAKMEEYKKKWDDVMALFHKRNTELLKLEDSAGRKETVSKIGKHVDDYAAGFNSVYGRIKSGEITTTQDANKAIGNYKESIHQSETIIGDYAKENDKRMALKVREALEGSSSIKRAAFTVAACAFAIGLLLAVVISRGISRPLKRLTAASHLLAEGDLTVEADVHSRDEIGQLAKNINEMSGKLGGLISNISGIAANSAVFAHTLHSGAERIAAAVDEGSGQATGVATAGEEMSATSGDIAQNCQMAAEGARRASEAAMNGAAVVDATVAIMGRIAENVQQSARTVESLGERSDQIGEIIGTIEDIADQTNLLALNAAIEAARAGEQGRGFAVVADEVRALAERTTRATREIGEMIKAIQKETGAAVAAMETGVRQVENGTVEAAKSGEALRHILEQVNDVAMQVSQIATAAEEQTATTSEISGNMLRITGILQSTSREAYESAASTNRMNSHVEEMMTCFAGFRLNEDVRATISKAKSAHMIFIGKIKSHLDGSARIDGDKLPTHLTCAFGKWYQGKGQECCGTSSHFLEIDAPHAKVHELGKQAIAAFNVGDSRKAKELCDEMVANSEKLMGILDGLGQSIH